MEADGVSIEPQFYMDYEIDEDHTLRIFANRDEINKINLVKGTLAEKKNDVMKMDTDRKQPTADKKKEALI